MSYFKKEERTASNKQIEKLAEVFIGILNSQKKLDIDMTDKPTKADAVMMTVDCIREWETECKSELGDAFKPLTMSDISTFYEMSYRRRGVWHYEDDAAVIALVEEKMLEKFSSFCPMAALGEKQAETFTVNTYDPKTGESGSKTIKKKQPTKKKKTAKKQPVTLKVSEPVEKPISLSIKITDEVLELASSMGLSDTETAKFAHLLAKVNS